MKPLPVLVAVAVVAAAGVYGWRRLQPTDVTVVTLRRTGAAEIVYATGTVEPRVWAKIAPTVRERIVEICDCEGRRVTRGEVLARLDDTRERALFAEAQARAQLARLELDRITRLVERATSSRQELDRAQSEFAQATARVAAQRAALDDTVIKAPIDGVVLRLDGRVGEIAETGTPLMWIGEPKPLRVVADVNEEHMPKVAVGQDALVASDAFPGRSLAAKVDAITPKGDPVAKTWRVYLALPEDTPLMIGMTVDVDVVVSVVADAMTLPIAAFSGDRVAVVADGHIRLTTVKVGLRDNRNAAVSGGIEATDPVVVPFPAKLADGAAVRSGGRRP